MKDREFHSISLRESGFLTMISIKEPEFLIVFVRESRILYQSDKDREFLYDFGKGAQFP